MTEETARLRRSTARMVAILSLILSTAFSPHAAAYEAGNEAAVRQLAVIQPTSRAPEVRIDWYLFSRHLPERNRCNIRFKKSFALCRKIKSYNLSKPATLRHIIFTQSAITGIDGTIVCSYICVGGSSFYIGRIYEQHEPIIGYIYINKKFFGFLIQSALINLGLPIENSYDIFISHEYLDKSVEYFQSLKGEISKKLEAH